MLFFLQKWSTMDIVFFFFLFSLFPFFLFFFFWKKNPKKIF